MKTMNRRLLMMTIAALGLSSVYAGQECSAGITCPANTAVSAALYFFSYGIDRFLLKTALFSFFCLLPRSRINFNTASTTHAQHVHFVLHCHHHLTNPTLNIEHFLKKFKRSQQKRLFSSKYLFYSIHRGSTVISTILR